MTTIARLVQGSEVKCPYQGRASALWGTVGAGELPEHYWWRVQHQLLVARAAVADVFVFDGSDGLLLQVEPKPESWEPIRSGWDVFSGHVARTEPPPLTDRDVRTRDDAEWLGARMAATIGLHGAAGQSMEGFSIALMVPARAVESTS